MFYENDLNHASIVDLPTFQYGPMLTRPERSNFSVGDWLRPFIDGPYRWQGVALPRADLIRSNRGMTAFQQIEDRIQVPPRSWLLGFSACSEQTAGFRFSVFDVGTKDAVLSQHWQANTTDATDNSASDGSPIHLLPYPYLVVAPGLLQVRIVNSANAVNDCQLLLHFAIPGSN